MKYFGAKANKILSYGVASVSGTILAVCSCTILPLFMEELVTAEPVGGLSLKGFHKPVPAFNVTGLK